MKKNRYIFAACIGLVSHQAIVAESLWDRRDPRAAYLFQDNRARKVGDILTVAISESTATNEREQRAMDRRTRNNDVANFNGSYTIGAGSSASGTLASTGGTDMRRRFDGSAQVTSDRRFVDKMAVTVVDVLPNGNLVFEGYRSRVLAGEERVLRITGVVRPADIAAGNTVQSSFIANFKVSYNGRGAQSEFTSQPLLGRILNYILP